jgi:hypothetical protein
MAFVLYGPEATNGLNIRRAVRVAFESSWNFVTIGEPQTFEDLTRYTARRIRERLDEKAVLDYCAAIGLRPREESFYAPEALVYAYPEQAVPGRRMETFAEAQHRLGLR